MKCPRCPSKLRAENDTFGAYLVCFCGHREPVGVQPEWRDMEGRGKVEMMPKGASKARLMIREHMEKVAVTTAEKHTELMKHRRRRLAQW